MFRAPGALEVTGTLLPRHQSVAERGKEPERKTCITDKGGTLRYPRNATLFTVGVLSLALISFAAPAFAAPGDDTHPGRASSEMKGGPAPYYGDGTDAEAAESVDSAPTVQTVAGSCSYDTRGDYPHPSGSDVSAHGWWVYLSGSCPAQADVTVYLQQYWCDGWGCRWITRATGEKRVYAGGGSANRANARTYCDSSEYTGWRNVVDVDLVGVSDPADKAYITSNVYCRDY